MAIFEDLATRLSEMSSALRGPGVAARSGFPPVIDVFEKAGLFAANHCQPAGAVAERTGRVLVAHPGNTGATLDRDSAVSAHFKLSTDAEAMPAEDHPRPAGAF
jgi:hypothetical protein